MKTTTSRGIRNNNPLNIRRGEAWQGLSEKQQDPSFCQFENEVYGIRAAIIIMRTYYYRYNLSTIEQVITRWAPPEDHNNTEAYINFVVRMMAREHKYMHRFAKANWWLTDKTPNYLFKSMLMAMCMQESGYYLTEETYKAAIAIL